MDDRLVQVLHKVELLCEKYPEFAAALKKKLHVETTVTAPSSTIVLDERVDKIVQYLGLDFKLDTATPADTKYAEVTYSFITDVAVPL